MQPGLIKDRTHILVSAQDGVSSLDVFQTTDDHGNPVILTHWYPNEDELRALINGAPVQLWAMTSADHFYPVTLTVVAQDG